MAHNLHAHPQRPALHPLSAPLSWLLATLIGLAAGYALSLIAPANFTPPAPAGGHAGAPSTETADHPTVVEVRKDGSRLTIAGPGVEPAAASSPTAPAAPHVPLALCAPFALLLLSIALFPIFAPHFWHERYPEIALALGGLMLGYYLSAFGAYGRASMAHVGIEYAAFLALVGGLFVVSGGILIDARGRATPFINTALLAFGAIIANAVGTTGASVLLIRPFMHLNQGRLKPLHVVFFIFIVSNCGGCLTPIGDPPLFLGYLKGVPFSWTLSTLWPMWLVVVGCLLALFFILDSRIPRTGNAPGQTPEPFSVRVRGTTGLVCLALMIAGVFVAPLLDRFFAIKEALWAGAIFQIAVATFAYLNAPRDIHAANDFNFGPVKEVGLLFAGIFATMAPALAYLQANGSALGLTTPTHFYFATGVLSATLDNAPTYLSFLQVAFSVLGLELNPANLQRFIDHTFIIGTGPDAKTVVGAIELEAISLAAVFFGAMTYIGNGPNFMVKAIAEARGLKMPSFFGYVGYATLFLFPILVLNWFVFIR